MNFLDIILIGLALAMDAFGVSLGIGINSSVIKKQKLLYIISFAFFQFLFTFLGGYLGYFFNTYIANIPKILGGIIIGIVGIFMIIEGMKEEKESVLTKPSMIFILGMSVSIDALVIGFTAFNYIEKISILLLNSSIIGIITFIMCVIAFFICRYIKTISYISKYADFFGGGALIFFSLKLLFF